MTRTTGPERPAFSNPLRHLDRLLGARGGLHPWVRGLLGVSLLLVLLSLAVSIDDVRTSGGEDLRPHVLGARAMLAGLDPYTYEATPETPEELQDHTRFAGRITRSTYTPAMLFLYGPLCGLPWGLQRALWAALEWAALLFSILLLAGSLRRSRDRVAFLLVANLFFAASYFFRLHVERGQAYVFLVLLLTAWSTRLLAARGDLFWPGLALGAAIALRPTLVVIVPIAWLAGLRRTSAGAVVGALALVGLTLPLVGLSGWLGFLRHADLIGRWSMHDAATMAVLGKPLPAPAILEGADFSRYLPGLSGNLTLWSVLAYLVHGSSRAAAWLRETGGLLSKVVAAIAVLVPVAVCLRGGLRERALSTRLALSLVVALLVDYCLPVRVSYADVLFLPPLALLARGLLSRRVPRVFALLVLAGLVCGVFLLTVAWRVGYPGALLRAALVTAGLLGAAVWLSHGRRTARAALPAP